MRIKKCKNNVKKNILWDERSKDWKEVETEEIPNFLEHAYSAIYL